MRIPRVLPPLPPPAVLAALFWLGGVFAASPGEACAQTAARIATWNIETVGVPGSAEHLAALAVMGRIDADVVAIQEVGSTADAANLQALALSAGYPFTIVPSGNPFGALRNAVLSRWPFAAAPVIHTSPSLSGDPAANDLTRWIVEVTVAVPGGARDLTLVTEHWKAGSSNADEFRRGAESLRIGQVLAGHDPLLDPYLVVGDVNDEIDVVPHTPAVFTSLPAGLPQSFSLGTDLQGVLAGPGIANDAFQALTLAPVPKMFALNALQLDGSDATLPVSGNRFDYVFVSQVLLFPIPPAEVYDSNDEGLPGGLPKSGLPLPASTSTDASNHLLVFADVIVPAAVSCGAYASYGAGLPGTGGFTPRIAGSGCPAPGQLVSIDVTQGLGAAAGVVLVGVSQASVPSLGGVILAAPLGPPALLLLGGTPGVAGAGASSLPLLLPSNPNLSGLDVFWQGLFLDPGAVQGVSFTAGLQMTVG